MAKTVKINNQTYNDVKEVKLPLASDPSTMAVFPDTSDANVTAEKMASGSSGYANGKKVEGSLVERSAGGGDLSTKDATCLIEKGIYDGTGKVGISDTEKAKLIPGNIRKGVTVLGVEGSMSSTEGANPQAKSVTPTESEQVVLPDSGYNYLSQVTVGPIPSTHIKTDDATAEAQHIAKDETAYVNGKKVVGTHTDPSFTLANNVLTIK